MYALQGGSKIARIVSRFSFSMRFMMVAIQFILKGFNYTYFKQCCHEY